MILSSDEAPDFFTVLAALDTFANRRLKLVPDVDDIDDMRHTSLHARHKIRTAVWTQPSILAEFARTNPFDLPERLIEDARRFQHAVTGRFFCERILKRHAIVISMSEPTVVYAMEGLSDPVNSVLSRTVPGGVGAMFDTTLLPWRGRIVWDGLISILSIHAGPGIRRSYTREYTAAKDAGAVVTSLGEAPRITAKPRKASRDWRPVMSEIIAATDALGKTDTALQAATFSMLQASARLAQATLDGGDESVLDAARRVDRAWRKTVRLIG